jgi:hypothetical protein
VNSHHHGRAKYRQQSQQQRDRSPLRDMAALESGLEYFPHGGSQFLPVTIT